MLNKFIIFLFHFEVILTFNNRDLIFPEQARSLKLLNISSAEAGTNPWGTDNSQNWDLCQVTKIFNHFFKITHSI